MCVAVLLLACLPERLRAEELAPAHLSTIDGALVLERDGQEDAAILGMPVIPGDRLRTTAGRAEILFDDGTAIALDEYTAVDVQAATLVRLNLGRVRLTVSGSSTGQFRIDTPVAAASTQSPGEYRVSVVEGRSGPNTELAVFRGIASLSTDRDAVSLGAGQLIVARADGMPRSPNGFNSARMDPFDQWASARRDERRGTSQAAQYLPADLRTYGGTFEQNGAWEYEASAGYVWYPNVAADWRPYSDGYWEGLPVYGWTWIGVEAWAWPTHHYGRWGYARSRWYWVPERHWAPAWVSWAGAPGYVSWCPLGYDNRPVFALSATSVSAGRSWTAGWVVTSRDSFGARRALVARTAGAPLPIPAATAFVVQRTAPVQVPARSFGNATGQGAGPAGPRGRADNIGQRPLQTSPTAAGGANASTSSLRRVTEADRAQRVGQAQPTPQVAPHDPGTSRVVTPSYRTAVPHGSLPAVGGSTTPAPGTAGPQPHTPAPSPATSLPTPAPAPPAHDAPHATPPAPSKGTAAPAHDRSSGHQDTGGHHEGGGKPAQASGTSQDHGSHR
jgi:hypothetical protein